MLYISVAILDKVPHRGDNFEVPTLPDLCHIHGKGESSSAAVLRARCRYSASTTTLATLTSWRLAGDGGGLDWASALGPCFSKVLL